MTPGVAVSSPDEIDSPEGTEKAWVETLKDGGNVSILLTVAGYVLKSVRTTSDVHVDTITGKPRRWIHPAVQRLRINSCRHLRGHRPEVGQVRRGKQQGHGALGHVARDRNGVQ